MVFSQTLAERRKFTGHSHAIFFSDLAPKIALDREDARRDELERNLGLDLSVPSEIRPVREVTFAVRLTRKNETKTP